MSDQRIEASDYAYNIENSRSEAADHPQQNGNEWIGPAVSR